MDCCSTHRLRFNEDGSVHQADPLAHAGETQTFTFQGCFEIEPSPQIADDEVNLTRLFPQLHADASDSAVLDGVVQGFLQNSKQRKSNLIWQDTEHITLEVDLHFLPRSKFPAPAFYTRNHAQVFQF